MSRMGSVAAADLTGLNLGGSGPFSAGNAASGPQGEASPAPQEKVEEKKPEEKPESVQDAAEKKPDAELEKKPEDKPEEKPEEKESEVKKINNQIRALNRIQANQQKVAAQLEKRATELESVRVELEARYNELQQFEELSNLKPLEVIMKVAEKKGMPFKDFLRSAISHAATGEPEEETKKEETKEEELSPAMKKILDELTDLKTKLTEKEKQELEAERQAELEYEESLISGFASSAIGLVNEDAYPLLDAMDRNVLADEILSTANRYAEKTGEPPDLKELLDYLEERETAKAEKLTTRLQKKSGSVKNSTEAANASTPERGAGSPATDQKAEAPRPVSNSMAGERGSGVDSPLRTDRARVSSAADWLATFMK